MFKTKKTTLTLGAAVAGLIAGAAFAPASAAAHDARPVLAENGCSGANGCGGKDKGEHDKAKKKDGDKKDADKKDKSGKRENGCGGANGCGGKDGKK